MWNEGRRRVPGGLLMLNAPSRTNAARRSESTDSPRHSWPECNLPRLLDARTCAREGSFPASSLVPGLSHRGSSSNSAGREDRNYFNDFLKPWDCTVDYQTRSAKSPGMSATAV